MAFLCPGKAKAQTRIQFAKGRNSATVRGKTGSYGVYYVVRARAGQKISLDLSPVKNVGIEVENARGDDILLREESGGVYEVYLEEGGDITILVRTVSGKSVPYSLTVKITKISDI